MRMVVLLAIAVLLVVAVPGLAWAYIDPGSSSMAYQVLLAGALAVGFALRRGWHWLGDHFAGRRWSDRKATGNFEPKSKP